MNLQKSQTPPSSFAPTRGIIPVRRPQGSTLNKVPIPPTGPPDSNMKSVVIGSQTNPSHLQQPIRSSNMEQAFIQAMEVITAQAAYFAPIVQSSMSMNAALIKLQESNMAERKRMEEKHAETIALVDRLATVVDSLQKSTTLTSLPAPMRPIPSPSPSETFLAPSDPRLPETPQKLTKMKSPEKNSKGVRSSKRISTPSVRGPESENHVPSKRPREEVMVGKIQIGKGHSFDETLKKYTSYGCDSCETRFSSEKKLVEHFHGNHDDWEQTQRKKTKSKK